MKKKGLIHCAFECLKVFTGVLDLLVEQQSLSLCFTLLSVILFFNVIYLLLMVFVIYFISLSGFMVTSI